MAAAMINPFAAVGAPPQASQEVMRLTAAADDLRQRLRVATDKSAQLEAQLQRSQSIIQRERQDAQQQISSAKAEMATVRGAELKLRTELAQRPTVTEFKQNKFNDAVRTAMEAEEMSARVADSEARVVMLTKRYDALQAEVNVLEKAKAEAIEVTAANSKAMFTEEQVSEKVAKLAETSTLITQAEERLAVLTDDVAKNEALRDSNRADAIKAETEVVTANEALVAAVGDLTATKQEQGEIAVKVTMLKAKLSEVEAKITAAREASEAPVATAVQRRMTVTGAMPPTTTLGFPVDSTTRRIDAMGCSGCGVPYHLNTDAPIALGTYASTDGSAGSSIDEMVKAIVTDLKGYLAFAAEENSKRGIAHGSATGEGAAAIEVM